MKSSCAACSLPELGRLSYGILGCIGIDTSAGTVKGLVPARANLALTQPETHWWEKILASSDVASEQSGMVHGSASNEAPPPVRNRLAIRHG